MTVNDMILMVMYLDEEILTNPVWDEEDEARDKSNMLYRDALLAEIENRI